MKPRLLIPLLLISACSNTMPRYIMGTPCELSHIPEFGPPSTELERCVGILRRAGTRIDYFVTVDNVDFWIGLHAADGVEEVVWYETSDLQFRTPEGISNGDRMSDVSLIPGSSRPDSTHFCSIDLPSGWTAEFTLPDQCNPDPSHPADCACALNLDTRVRSLTKTSARGLRLD
jgi:hypothetical protein